MTDQPPSLGRRDLTEGSVYGNLFHLAWPFALGMMLHALYNVVDAWWLGRLSSEAIGAIGASMPLVFLAISLGMGFGHSGSALISQHIGARRPRRAYHVTGQLFLILACIAVAFAIPLAVFTRPLLRLYQLPEANMPETLGYLRIFVIGMPFIAMNIGYMSALRSLGDTITMVFINLVANLLNIALDPLFIFTAGLGTSGAALASVICQIVAFCICVVLLRREHSGLSVRLADLRPEFKVMRKIFDVALPAGIAVSNNSIGILLFHVMVNAMGPTVLATFTIGNRVTQFVMFVGHAMAMAAAPIVGQALGAGRPDLARRVVMVSVKLTAFGLIIPYALLTWKGPLVASFFTRDPAVVEEAARFFLLVPFSNYLFVVFMVLSAAFYGSGHTRPVLYLAIIRNLLLRLPISFLLAILLGWGSMGLYIGFMSANVVAAILTAWIFHRGRWLRAVVKTREDDEPEEEPPEDAEGVSGDESGPSVR